MRADGWAGNRHEEANTHISQFRESALKEKAKKEN